MVKSTPIPWCRLSPAACSRRRAIASRPNVKTAIALVEIGEAIQRGVFTLSEPFDDFVARLDRTPSRYQLVPLTAAIVCRAHELYAIPERSDRLIAATAQELGCPIVTRDAAIAAAIGEKQLW